MTTYRPNRILRTRIRIWRRKRFLGKVAKRVRELAP